MKNLENQIFGDTVVIQKDPNKTRHTKWLCKCKCGDIRSVLQQTLLRGQSNRCRKCQFDHQRIRNKLPNTLWWRINHNAEQRNLKITCTQDELYKLYVTQKKLCALSAIPISLEFDLNRKVTASLDRIDSSKGYDLDNVQWVHKDINFMKQAFNQDYFISLCKAIVINDDRISKCFL